MSVAYRRGGSSGVAYKAPSPSQQTLIEVPGEINIMPEEPESEVLTEKKKIKKNISQRTEIIKKTPFKEDQGKI